MFGNLSLSEFPWRVLWGPAEVHAFEPVVRAIACCGFCL